MKTHPDYDMHMGHGHALDFDLDEESVDHHPSEDYDTSHEEKPRGRRSKRLEHELRLSRARRVLETLRDQKRLRSELDDWFESDISNNK
jgi:hypothetical protein